MVSRLPGVRSLDPGAFAFVMATGIVSVGLLNAGATLVSTALLVVASVGYILLAGGYGLRWLHWRKWFLADVVSPRGFGFLTAAAASNVLANRMVLGDLRWPAVALLAVGTVGWLVLGYGVPVVLIAGGRRRPVPEQVNGSWFLWVVATQSVAAAAGSVDRTAHIGALAVLAVVCWAIGLVLYGLLAALALARLLLHPVRPATMTATYWVFMGAAAITVHAGARLLDLPESERLLPHPAVVSVSVVLWAFASWLIPLLLVLGVWRHVLRRVPLRYETGLWSLVFPLGMYGAASHDLGRATGTPWLSGLATVEGWVAAAVWAAVFAAMLATLVRNARRATRPSPAP